MFRFGFELEGFFTKGGTVCIPPKGYPTDGFPGLMEVRSSGAKSIHDAYMEVFSEYVKYSRQGGFLDNKLFEHTFTPAEKKDIRARHNEKTAVNIENIYGKSPRALGNRTIASLQLNVSWQTRNSYHDDKGIFHSAQFGLFDFLPIIRKLDEEFKDEIKDAGRQPGFYSVKDGCRVEYRSLPNNVFTTTTLNVSELIERFEKVFK